MKLSVFSAALGACALLIGNASAVVTFFAGSGTVNLDGSPVSGARVIFVSSSIDISASSATAFDTILASGGTSAEFDSTLATLLTGSTPGISPRAGVVTDGAGFFNSLSNEEVGAAGNQTYLFIVAETAGQVDGIGVYRGTNVPAFGPININTATDTPILGTSDGTFNLVAAVPEPSIALLGAFGILGLLRRRR